MNWNKNHTSNSSELNCLESVKAVIVAQAYIILYIMHIQVSINIGLTNSRDNFELCVRAENVELPRSGYFGVSAATGALAGMCHRNNCLLINTERSSYARTVLVIVIFSVYHTGILWQNKRTYCQ